MLDDTALVRGLPNAVSFNIGAGFSIGGIKLPLYVRSSDGRRARSKHDVRQLLVAATMIGLLTISLASPIGACAYGMPRKTDTLAFTLSTLATPGRSNSGTRGPSYK